MKKLYLILLFLCLLAGMLKADSWGKENPSPNQTKYISNVNMTPCDSPTVNADTLLMEYLTHRPLSAMGGAPPYTYNFSPPISSSELVAMPDTNITFTITVTGANGCSSRYHAIYDAVKNISSGSCITLFMSEYIQDTLPGPSGSGINDAIELYNPTPGPINLNSYYLVGSTHMSMLTPFIIPLHGTIAAHKTFLIANTFADTSLTHKAGMLSDSLSFGGLDIVSLAQLNISAPTVTFSFLDEIGSISPLPTDSGWIVGSGSTKNHTLVRQTSVTQGSMNWMTCRTQWNVYSRGTFSYIGTYSNVCDPADAKLYVSFGNPTVTCGDPSYFNFDILIQADSAKKFDGGTFAFIFSGSEFTGDNIYDNSITDTLGPDFQYAPGNDYNLLTFGQSGNSVNGQIGFGSSPWGTTVDSIPKVLFHISMKIQNSCGTGTIKFDRSVIYPWQYVYDDSTFSHMDSVKSWYSLIRIHCGDTLGPPYLCHGYCCSLDSVGNCDDSCYDTCTTYPVYCEDTVWHYAPDSVYSYPIYKNVNYSTVFYTDSLPTAGGCPPVIEPLDPVNAGTNDASVPPKSSILTINGANFGNVQGVIQVPDANKGGSRLMALDSTDILSWTNSKIIVRMPSVVFPGDTLTPGSGNIILQPACGSFTGAYLTINYNIMNEATSNEKLRYNMAMSNDSNSIVFRCDTSISNHPRIYADVLQAIETWNCFTGINWKMGNDTMLENRIQDRVSVIYFSPIPLYSNHLMETISYVDNSCNNMGDSMTYVHEADIAINRIPYAGYAWNYDVSDTAFPGINYYFYDVLLHELGHAHLLNHMDDTNSVMYYQANIHSRRNLLTGAYPGPQTLYAGYDVVNTSATNTPSCSYRKLIPSPRTCTDATLNVVPISGNQYSLILYPNPVSNQNLTVSYELTQGSYIQFKIIDYTGREVMKLGDEHKLPGTYKQEINTNGFASGIYLFIANINGTVETIKCIKL